MMRMKSLSFYASLKVILDDLFFLLETFFLLEQNRTWIYKPRYSYAGQGIHVISSNSDLEPIFKTKMLPGNRIQHQPKSPGYLMQE